MAQQLKKAFRDMFWFFIGIILISIILSFIFVIGFLIISVIKEVPRAFYIVLCFFKEYWLGVVIFISILLISIFFSTLLENTKFARKIIKAFQKVWYDESDTNTDAESELD